ncbi:putative 3-hydroxyisobutyryl-CoA hydrolase [Medicago truncatula]|uniref:3-hydroxyisobutyryl-CoA hydrolase n=1 Tax=Medicago truncatula TaxID=3880 RepID=G7LBK0_MEDTR|nr:3-hydroxyisobutyryl-CoA hydrolase-like protein 1, mitochondrial [Medicago truncatula]AET01172.1 enoyl-CoA hydratase/isomerase [Medicago truncatula]RHN38575.1 putative 3-hydroxyisobutyryl-CoA hydrolase [Medicago truncatula]
MTTMMQWCRRSLLMQRNSRRLTTTLSNSVDHHLLQDNVLVEGNGYSRLALLNRPSSLNAINTNMAARLHKLYRSWEDNPDIGFVMLKGTGRAFAAGGDIVSLYRFIKQGNLEACKQFFRTAYSFIYLIGTYLKPHVALLNGITMGGGAGISIPGTFRLATDKTVFATPEVLIGFHPDAAASFYLSRLPGHIGEYLALTGEKLNGVEMVACGLATHYSLLARLPLIEEQLGKLVTDDPSVIETTLEQYGDLVHPGSSSVLQRLEILDKCFGHDTVEEIVDALEVAAGQTKDAWCISTLNRLKEASPLSLKVSLRSIREGRFQTLDQCLLREYRMTLQAISKQISGDFCEGVRARVVDKDMAPKWDPPTLEKVSQDMVDQYFLPLTEFEPDLELPTKSREAFL